MATKLIILRGLPASGKSTYAKEEVLKNPNSIIRVCRDDIRHMFGQYWVPEREVLVTDIEDECIKSGLERGYSVIIDATNFFRTKEKMKMLIDFWEIENITIEFKDFFNVPIGECINRDLTRVNPVGKQVIEGFYNKYSHIIKQGS